MSGPTDKHIALVYATIAAGGSVASFAGAVGINARTVHKWLEQPDKGENYRRFGAEYARARAEFRDGLVGHIQAAAPKDWKAAAWLLERMHWQEFSRSTKQQVTEQIHSAVSRIREEFGDELGDKVLRVFAEQEREEGTRAQHAEH